MYMQCNRWLVSRTQVMGWCGAARAARARGVEVEMAR